MKYEIIKGNEKCFEGAPEWAAYLAKIPTQGCFAWVSLDDDYYQYLSSGSEYTGGFLNVSWSGGMTIIAQRRPTTEPVWHGAGLPPVGFECEMSYAGDEWRKCTIIAKGSEQIIFKQDGCREFSGHKNNYKFRPIRPPEDVARDEFIKELSGNVIEGFSIGTLFAAALYDAGYRKME